MSRYNPLVSIIVNTHNSVEFIQEAIESAFAQTYKNTEIIVYDNASTEDILSYIPSYQSSVKYYRSETFLTLGQARNEALKLANGEIIDFLDADDLFLPDKLASQVPLFGDPKIGLVYSNSYHTNLKDNKWEEHLIYGVKEQRPEGHIFKSLLKSYSISFDTTIFRKSAIGTDPDKWFPEKFNLATDYDLFLKISHKYKVGYVKKGLSKWRNHEENWSTTNWHLAPAELTLMLPRIEEYEPDLYNKYRKELVHYFSNLQRSQANHFWSMNFRKNAWFEFLSTFTSTFQLKDLIKVLIVPFISLQAFSRLKKIFKHKLHDQ
jgi:glycosyltransferase involved in cell wall biosynthesis